MFLFFGLFGKKEKKNLLVPLSTLKQWQRETNNNLMEMFSRLALVYAQELDKLKIEASSIWNKVYEKLLNSTEIAEQRLVELNQYLQFCSDCDIGGTTQTIIAEKMVIENQIQYNQKEIQHMNQAGLTCVTQYNNGVCRLNYLRDNTEIEIKLLTVSVVR